MTGGDGLATLVALARQAGSSWIADEAEALTARLREGRFYVVCVGQFKRGKSTLLNALIGAPVLPTGVVPITAAVTVLRHGERLAELGHLLTAEQERLAGRLDEARERFLAQAGTGAERELREAIRRDASGGPALRGLALEHAREVARRWLERWRREQEPQAAALYGEMERRFSELVNTFQAQLVVVPGLETLPPLPVYEGFRSRSGLFFTELMSVAPASPAHWLSDRLLPWRRMAAIEGSARDYLERLLQVNSARINNDFAERALQSRRLLEADVRARLRGALASAAGALENARRLHAAGATAVQAQLDWLEALRVRVEACSSRSG